MLGRQCPQLEDRQQQVPLSLLQARVAELLQDVLQGDVAGVEAQDQLFGLGPGQQVRVEGVGGEVGGQGGRQLGGGLLGGRPLDVAPAPGHHVFQDLLLRWGVLGENILSLLQ